MPPQDDEKLLERRDRALEKMDAGHQALVKSLEGLGTEEAFLGSRWSVWEVLKHLDSAAFVDSLGKLMAGESEMLPPFDSRDAHLKRDIQSLMDTSARLRELFSGLSAEQLSRPTTPNNPHNNFPSLSMISLMERVVQHEGNHALQIEATRKYVAEFSAKIRAVTFAGLGEGEPSSLRSTMAMPKKCSPGWGGRPEADSGPWSFAWGTRQSHARSLLSWPTNIVTTSRSVPATTPESAP